MNPRIFLQQHPHLREWLHIVVLMQFPASLVLRYGAVSVLDIFICSGCRVTRSRPSAEACRKRYLLLRIRTCERTVTCIASQQHSYSRTCKAGEFHSIANACVKTAIDSSRSDLTSWKDEGNMSRRDKSPAARRRSLDYTRGSINIAYVEPAKFCLESNRLPRPPFVSDGL